MTQHADPSDRGQNKATARTLQVLSCFAADAPGYGVTELSQLLGMTKNMIYRALTTLVDQGYLVRDASGARYQLGFRVLELQSRTALEPDFRSLCAPYVQKIHALTGETVSLMVRGLDYAVFIDGIETKRPGTWRMEIGGLRPLHVPASGRVMLASCTDREIEEYIARHSPLTIPPSNRAMTAEQLWADIRAIRRQGYAMVRREGPLPMLAMGFPIVDAENRLHGVLSVGGPVERMEGELQRLLPELRRLIDELCSRTRLYAADAAHVEIN
ncbi:IclR family transcriptional regulator [Niveispirillum fermenti]|uniref:IclR family transcriptional regulator n=1 Tax=Niveispirillum fermenti TaxID=1233113 RepID=UPI003A8A10EF